MQLKVTSEDIQNATKELHAIVDALGKRAVPTNDLFSEVVQRVANLEARMQTLESLLTSKTMAGKPKLSDEGKRVGVLWYQK